MKTRLLLFLKARKLPIGAALIALTCAGMSGCVTTADGTKKFAPFETVKRADKSVDNYFERM